jgi:hypothetical protein
MNLFWRNEMHGLRSNGINAEIYFVRASAFRKEQDLVIIVPVSLGCVVRIVCFFKFENFQMKGRSELFVKIIRWDLFSGHEFGVFSNKFKENILSTGRFHEIYHPNPALAIVICYKLL